MSLQRIVIGKDMLRYESNSVKYWFLKMVPLTGIHPPERYGCAIFKFWEASFSPVMPNSAP